jgi:hypothetical protein
METIDRSRRRESGYGAVWVLVLLALFGSLMIGVIAHDEPATPWWVGGCLVAAMLGTVWEFRRDPFEAASITAVIAFIVAFFSGLPVFLADEPLPFGLWALFLGSTGVGVGCWVYRARVYNATDVLVNPLLDRFSRSTIREQDGIQFVTWTDRQDLVAGGRFNVHVMAQSCWDEPRMFGIKLLQESIGRKWMVIHEAQPEVEIAGGEAVLMSIPVLTHPKAKGHAQLSLAPVVRGQGGTRVRRFRAQTFQGRASGSWLQVVALALMVGVFVSGGGTVFRIKIRRGDKNAAPPEGPLPMEVETVYSPEPTELKAIAMGVIG